MSGFFSALMIRMFTGGIICTLALMLAGDGPRREIVRLCCACLMIIFILTPLGTAEISLDSILEGKADVEEQISQGLDQAKQQEYNVVAGQLEKWVEEQAGFACTARLTYTEDGENAFTITGLTVTADADQGQKEALADLIVRNLGIAREQIIWQPKTGE